MRETLSMVIPVRSGTHSSCRNCTHIPMNWSSTWATGSGSRDFTIWRGRTMAGTVRSANAKSMSLIRSTDLTSRRQQRLSAGNARHNPSRSNRFTAALSGFGSFPRSTAMPGPRPPRSEFPVQQSTTGNVLQCPRVQPSRAAGPGCHTARGRQDSVECFSTSIPSGGRLIERLSA